MIRKRISFFGLFILFAFSVNFFSYEELGKKETATEILEKMAVSFEQDLIFPMFLLANIRVLDEDGGNWQVVVNGKEVRLNRIQEDRLNTPAQVTLSMSKDTLDKINQGIWTATTALQGIWTATTALAQSKASDPTPINIQFASGLNFAKLEQEFFYFMDHFFNWRKPETFELGLEHTRPAHGGHVIPLHYGRGFRSGWCIINKGEKINAEKEKNPFPQLIIMLKGTGYGEIDGEVHQFQPGQCLYVPPNSTHIFWTDGEESAEAIFMAWEY